MELGVLPSSYDLSSLSIIEAQPESTKIWPRFPMSFGFLLGFETKPALPPIFSEVEYPSLSWTTKFDCHGFVLKSALDFYHGFLKLAFFGANRWSSPVARQAHNLKVVGSNPAPATNLKPSEFPMISGVFWWSSIPVFRR